MVLNLMELPARNHIHGKSSLLLSWDWALGLLIPNVMPLLHNLPLGLENVEILIRKFSLGIAKKRKELTSLLLRKNLYGKISHQVQNLQGLRDSGE